MNLVGKIFTVLIFVMSIFFMTMALMVYATHKNWKDVVLAKGGLKEQLTQVRTEKDDLTTARDKLQKDLDDLKGAKQKELAALENEITLKNQEIKERESSEAKLKQTEREAVAAMTAALAQNETLHKEIVDLRQKEEQAQADRDKHFQEVQRLTDELHDRVNELSTLKERSRTLSADLAKATDTLRLFKLNPNIDYTLKQPPDVVEGQVAAVRSGGLIEISLGADQGLLKGHKLEVYRAGKYLGRVNVVEIKPDRAVCKIDPIYQQGEFKNGDSVTSKLVER